MKYAKYALLPILVALIFLLRALPDLTGKPLFRSPMYNSAERYLQEHYPGTELLIEDIFWSDHGGDYHAKVYAPGNGLIRFQLVIDAHSKEVIEDTYTVDVLGGKTMAERLSEEYAALAEEVLAQFPCGKGSGLLDLEEGAVVPGEAYDINALGKTFGSLYLFCTVEEATIEEAARLLLLLKEQMDARALPFYSAELYLYGSGSLSVWNFLYEDIYADGLEERIEAKSTLLPPADG